LADRDTVHKVAPLLTEWCENSCDIGRPGSELQREFPTVQGLRELDLTHPGWCKLTAEQVRQGHRESSASVEDRCRRMVDELVTMPEASVALVSHCMLLQRLQRQLELRGGKVVGKVERTKGLDGLPPFLGNAEARTLRVWL